MLNFQGLIKKEVQFPGVIKKTSCGISRSLSFGPSNFQGVQHNLVEFPGEKLCFVWSFQSRVE